MKRSLINPFAALALGLALACWPVIGHAQTTRSTEFNVSSQDCVHDKTPETLLARLDDAFSLTAEQKIKANEIFVQQIADLQALSAEDHSTTAKELDQLQKAVKIRTAARAQVRALLTTEQQSKFDRTPQALGGGQTMSPENRATRLDEAVSLTAEQKTIANAIYEEEAEALLAFLAADRPTLGRAARQACKERIQALLTPEQRARQEAHQHVGAAQVAEEKAFVERVVRSSNAITLRVGTIKSLSSLRSNINEFKGQFRNGSYVFNVTGTHRTETFVVYWERPLPTAELKAGKIEDSTGQTIQP